MAQSVKLWFDVSCPFAWKTSRWIKEVEKHRDIELEFVPMSLAILNDGADIPADYAEKMKANWGPARVFARVKSEQPEKIDELYTAMGTLVHEEGVEKKDGFGAYDETIKKALEQVGLDAAYFEVANSEDADDELKKYHQSSVEAVGEPSGTPIVQFGDFAFFGPVITRYPEGEESGKLFDAVYEMGANPYFFELKRPRTEMPQVGALK